MQKLIIIFLSIVSIGFSQEFKISGTIRDGSSGEPLPFANISVKGELKGISTDFEGNYKLSLTHGKYELLISYIGYKTETIPIELTDKNIELNVSLASTEVLLQEVSVYAAAESSSPAVSSISLQSKEMEQISSGFPDVFRSIQSLPGLAANNEFNAKYNVRGGNFDENLVLVNGSQVYEPFHIKEADNASVGIFNLDLMRKVNLITGGFSAQYGDRLSSVLNIEYREGNKERYTGSATLSMIYLDAIIEGPLTSKSNFILGLRKSYLEYVLSVIDFDEPMSISFYDVQGVLTYNLSDINKLQLKFIHAGDDFVLDPANDIRGPFSYQSDFLNRPSNINEKETSYEEEDANYYSNLFDLQNTIILSSNAFLNTSVSYYYQIDREHQFYTEDYNFTATNNNSYFYKSHYTDNFDQDLSIKTWEAKSSLDFRIIPFYDIKTGFSYINLKYEQTLVDKEIQNIIQNIDHYPDTTSGIGSYFNDTQDISASSYKLNGYLENVFQLSNNIILNAGGRFDYFDFNKDLTFSPRFSASYMLSEGTNLRAAWGHYYQTPIYRQLAYSTPSDTNTQSQKAEHYILSIEKKFSLNNSTGNGLRNSLTIKAEGYYKKYSDLISSKVGSDGNISYSRKNDSKGYAAGLDLYASLKLGDYYGWISYGLLFAKEDLLEDNKGDFPRYTDQRHTLSIVNDYNLGKNWSVNLRFTYGSGFAYTPFYSQYNSSEKRFEWIESAKNSEHLPEYKRIDIRIGKEFSLFGFQSFAFMDVNNLLNSKNIYGFSYRFDSNGIPYREEIELWPIIPSLGLTVKF